MLIGKAHDEAIAAIGSALGYIIDWATHRINPERLRMHLAATPKPVNINEIAICAMLQVLLTYLEVSKERQNDGNTGSHGQD